MSYGGGYGNYGNGYSGSREGGYGGGNRDAGYSGGRSNGYSNGYGSISSLPYKAMVELSCPLAVTFPHLLQLVESHHCRRGMPLLSSREKPESDLTTY